MFMKYRSETHFMLAKKLCEKATGAPQNVRERLLFLANQHLALAVAAEKYDVKTTLHSYKHGINKSDLK